MKTLILLLIGFISYSQNNQSIVENEIIVKFKTVNSKEITSRFLENSRLSKLHSKINVSKYQLLVSKKTNNTAIVKFNSSIDIKTIISLYENTGLFEYVEPNYISSGGGMFNTTPNDSEYYNQWSLLNDGTFSADAVNGADIDMELAWDIELGDPNMIVAVIDTGLRLTHPEFSGRLWNNVNEVADGTDTDNNGFIDDVVAGWDFINNDNNPTDDHGHGTNVAGIALASGNNSIGYAGVNWNSKVMICKALDSNNSGSYFAMASAIYYAVDNGAKVINMSIGGTGNSTTLSDAVDYCYDNGVILVVSMMNFNNNTPYYPAAYNKTIAVGATDPDDTRSSPFFWDSTSGSNFGNHIDLVAPGNFMYGLDSNSDTYYGSYWGGTSQASPLVAGVVSLILAQNSTLTFEQIRTILHDSSEDQVGDSEDTPGFDIYYGYGRLNAYNALSNTVLNVDENESTTDFSRMYPNPIGKDNKLHFQNLKKGEYSINIYNTIGQRIYSIEKNINNEFELTITLPKLNTGTYFVKIQDKSKNSVLSEKIIIE